MQRLSFGRGLLIATGAVPLLAVLAMGFGHDPKAVPFVLMHKPAPIFSLQTLDHAQTLSLQSLRGKPVLINFWATWCYPCQAEHHTLQAAAQKYRERVHFLGIVYQDFEAPAKAYLAQKTSTYTQLVDTNSTTAMDFGVAGVPETFILDANGIIVHKQAGAINDAVIDGVLGGLL